MIDNHSKGASGLQVAFLVFAVVLLGAPLHKYLGPLLGIPQSSPIAGRLFIFIPAIAILLFAPALRRSCFERLSQPIIASRRIEVGLVSAAEILLPFAIFGAVALWYWILGGEMALARRIGNQSPVDVELARAWTTEGMLLQLLLAGIVAPVIEELVFRGFLYDAWKAQWGWFWAMLATSLVFAAYHPFPFQAFIASIVFVLVLRRAGSIRAPILVHAAGNIAVWYPLMGQFYFNLRGKETGEIRLWWFHLAMLGILAVALGIYAWMARDGTNEDYVEAETVVAR